MWLTKKIKIVLAVSVKLSHIPITHQMKKVTIAALILIPLGFLSAFAIRELGWVPVILTWAFLTGYALLLHHTVSSDK